MKKFLQSKNMIVFLLILIIMPIYVSLLSIDLLSFNENPVDVIIYLLLALLTIYFIYLLTTILEYVVLKITRLVEVNFVIIFPFTYDGSFRFTPIKLLSSQMNFQSSAVINLVKDIKKGTSGEGLTKKLKRILFIRITSTVLAYLMMFLLIGYFFHTFILIPLLVSCLFEIAMLFTLDNNYWRGTGNLLKNRDIEHYLYTLPNVKGLSADDYASYLDRIIDDIKESNKIQYIRRKATVGCRTFTIILRKSVRYQL